MKSQRPKEGCSCLSPRAVQRWPAGCSEENAGLGTGGWGPGCSDPSLSPLPSYKTGTLILTPSNPQKEHSEGEREVVRCTSWQVGRTKHLPVTRCHTHSKDRCPKCYISSPGLSLGPQHESAPRGCLTGISESLGPTQNTSFLPQPPNHLLSQ